MDARQTDIPRRLLGALAIALAAATASPADVPPPAETPVEVVVSGRTSTLKDITIVPAGREIPPNFSGGQVKNTPGHVWYVSRHYALKTNMPEAFARDCLIWAELAYPHAVRVLGREPEGLDRRRMVFVYGKDLGSLKDATWTDGGFRWGYSGGGVTFDSLRAAYNYPSGSLTYHKRDLVIHENLHLLHACVTGDCDNVPFRLMEGMTYALANHVYDNRRKRLTVAVLDKPTVNNMLDKALRQLARAGRVPGVLELTARRATGPQVGLFTQFCWTDPDRLMRWRLWRDTMLDHVGRGLRKADRRATERCFGDLAALDAAWRAWVKRRRSTFHYVDWGWEQVGDTLWSYGWPQKTAFSQTNIDLPPGRPAEPDPLRMDWPADPLPEHLVGPARRGGKAPSVAAVLDFSRNPGKGLCGLAVGVIEGPQRRPARLPRDAVGQINCYLRAGRTLVLDGRAIGLRTVEAVVPEPLRDAAAGDGHRFGLTLRVEARTLRATLRAGAKGRVGSVSASLPLTAVSRQRVLAEPLAVIARDGYHGVTPHLDAAREPAPDLDEPAPPNRWRFAGEDETFALYRAAWRLGEAAPGELLALRDRLAEAMDADRADQRAALADHARRLPGVLAAVAACEHARRDEAVADLLGITLELADCNPPDAPAEVVARLTAADRPARATVTFAGADGARGPTTELAAAPDRPASARWPLPPAGGGHPRTVTATAKVRCGPHTLHLRTRRHVRPREPEAAK